jgi:CheY-like chemotaxis protein
MVLVVENEPPDRMIAVELLRDAGLEVCEADRADEAIPILATHRDIRATFADVRMPAQGMATRSRTKFGRWPSIKIIVISGHTRVRKDSLPPGAVFMPKTYDPALPQCIKR